MRSRLMGAAVVTGTLAAMPMTSMTGRGDGEPPTTVAEVVVAAEEDDRAVQVLMAARRAERPAPAAADAPAAAPAPPAAPDEPTPIARVAGLELVVPSMETALVGFHEAAGPGTQTLESMAPLEEQHTARDVPVAADAVEEQVAPVITLPTRSRAAPATSAIDIAIPEGADVLAPVSGTVVMASPYSLYGQHADYRVEIEPDGHPGMRVILIHMDGLAVEAGDRLVAGETVIADTAKQFPFASQIDRFTAEREGRPMPHVHVEVKRLV